MSESPSRTAFEPSPRVTLAVCATVTAIAAIVRVLPAWGDFWLDEIWTYFSVRSIDSALDVFTRIHNSNNNHLNSLAMYWLGERTDWAVYRIPSLLAGVASVPLAAALARRHGRLEAILATILTGTSFVLVYFSSEARGYSLAVFFALAATWFLERELDCARWWSALGFGICSALGVLSHLVFLFYLAGAAGQSAWRLLRQTPGSSGARRLLRLLILPGAVLGWLYLVDLRFLEVGGGDATDLSLLFARTVGYTLGLPPAPSLAIPYLTLAAAVFLAGLRRLQRSGDDSWVLLAITIAAAPAAVLLVMRPEVIAVRYFIIGIAFWLLLVSRLLAVALRAGGWRRWLALAALGGFAAGNTAHFVPFLELGRGGYRAAVEFMAAHTDAPQITVGSDHDFRNRMVLRFYRRLLPEGRTLVYYREGERPRNGPGWMIVHHQNRPAELPRRLRDGNGNRYQLAAEFDHRGISGFHWALYRNLDPAALGGGTEIAPARGSGAPAVAESSDRGRGE